MGLTFEEYRVMALRTAPTDDREKMLFHGVFGLASEAGEVAGLLQKVYQGREIDDEHLMKECGDCLWMLAEIASAKGWDFDRVAETNINKLWKRFPDVKGFDVYKDQHRAEGDV
ncbi:MAG: nucleoside triphosphate pyrophosphohydrolase family protein [Bacteroidales bacterium]|nr:nucleoside triphosphate pyrophosphohydrolase family protein [Bacteroidales bacterium]